MNRTPKKPCKFCGSLKHYPYKCRMNPRKPKLKKTGKHTKQWLLTRAAWIRQNPPNHQGYWQCYLRISPDCQVWLTPETLTLDHIVPRSRDPSKRFVMDNLKPACNPCNTMKGSKNLDVVL